MVVCGVGNKPILTSLLPRCVHCNASSSALSTFLQLLASLGVFINVKKIFHHQTNKKAVPSHFVTRSRWLWGMMETVKQGNDGKSHGGHCPLDNNGQERQ